MNHYSSFCLRVLQGVNRGAIANFSSESVSVGSSDDCDIILSGFSTTEKYFEISFKNNTFLIRAINQPLYIDSIKVFPTQKFTSFKLYQLISFNGCCVTIGERGKKWPEISDKKDLSIKQYSKKPPHRLILNYTSSLTDKQKILFVTISFLLLGGILLLNIDSPKPSQKQLSVEVAASLPLDRKRDSAEKQAYALLQTFGVNRISLKHKKNGLLIAKGYVGSSKNWEKAKTSILGDIDTITEINTEEIETFSSRTIELNRMLQKKGIQKNLSIKVNEDQNRISISGELVGSDILTWNEVSQQFTKNYNNDPFIEVNITDIEKKLKLSIQGVSIGNTKYFISSSGKKYMIGADLGHGFKVEAIEIDKIILLYKGTKIPIFYSKLI